MGLGLLWLGGRRRRVRIRVYHGLLWGWMWMVVVVVVVVGLWWVVRWTVRLKGVEASHLLLVGAGLMRLLLPLDLVVRGRRLVVVEAVIVSRLLLLLGMWLSVLRVWWYSRPHRLLE